MRKKAMVITLGVFVLVLGFASIAEAGGRPRSEVWVDGELFGTHSEIDARVFEYRLKGLGRGKSTVRK